MIVLALSLVLADPSAVVVAVSPTVGYAGPGGVKGCLARGVDCETASAHGPAGGAALSVLYGQLVKGGLTLTAVVIPGRRELGVAAALMAAVRVGGGWFFEVSGGVGTGYARRPKRFGSGSKADHDVGFAAQATLGAPVAPGVAVILRPGLVVAYPGILYGLAGLEITL